MSLKNKLFFTIVFCLFFYFVDKNFLPEGLTNIQSRQYLGWIGIGILYGGLMVYVIGVVIYKVWKKDADQ